MTHLILAARRIRLFIALLCIAGATSCMKQGFDVLRTWPDRDSCEFFHVAPLGRIPIILCDMPADIVAAYQRLDSLARNYSWPEAEQYFSVMSNDSLLDLWHSFARMHDYDPFLAEFEYRWIEQNLPSGYRSTWQIALPLNVEYYSRFMNVPKSGYVGPNIANPGELVWISRGIYRVMGKNITERMDSVPKGTSGPPCRRFVRCFETQVRSIYKGLHYHSSTDSEHDALHGELQNMKFVVSRYEACKGGEDYMYAEDSSAFNARSIFPGKEYLVFISYHYNEGSLTQWTVRVIRKFEIINGFLLDPDQYFKQGKRLEYTKIDALLRSAMRRQKGVDSAPGKELYWDKDEPGPPAHMEW
jgi:hypothetical protein